MVWFFNGLKRKVEERSLQNWIRDLEVFQNVSGEHVTSGSVLGIAAAWNAVGLISDSIATLPVDAVIEEGDIRIPFDERPLWLDEPGQGLTSIDVRGQVLVSLLLRGEAFILTPRDELGRVLGLVVLDPDKMTQDPQTKQWSGAGEPIEPGELLVIRGLMLPGSTRGCSPITYAREVFGGAIATQKFGNAFFGNGAWQGAVVEMPTGTTLSENGQLALKAFINDRHKGAGNAHKIGVLTDGAKLSRPLSFSPEDSQFLGTRDFQVADVARMFFLDPRMIGGKTGDPLTYSTLATLSAHFVRFSLLRWLVRYEDAMTRLWHSEGGPDNGKIKLNVNGLLRGSLKERADVYALALNPDTGWMTVNEVRALEDLPPLDEQQPTKVGFNAA
jgi:HK97 family phage portal protein